jgi:hypothetical protein
MSPASRSKFGRGICGPIKFGFFFSHGCVVFGNTLRKVATRIKIPAVTS